MTHIAILKKGKVKTGDNLLQSILEGTKTIESRWYVNKIAPWNKIEKNDIVYFKETGKLITAKAEVEKVLQFEKLNKEMIESIVQQYGKRIAPNTSKEEWKEWAKNLSRKRYCILVFLKKVEKVAPFRFDKTGFGNSCAWICTKGVKKTTNR